MVVVIYSHFISIVVGQWWILYHWLVFSSTVACHQRTGEDWDGIRWWVLPALSYRQWIPWVPEHYLRYTAVHSVELRLLIIILVFYQWGRAEQGKVDVCKGVWCLQTKEIDAHRSDPKEPPPKLTLDYYWQSDNVQTACSPCLRLLKWSQWLIENV